MKALRALSLVCGLCLVVVLVLFASHRSSSVRATALTHPQTAGVQTTSTTPSGTAAAVAETNTAGIPSAARPAHQHKAPAATMPVQKPAMPPAFDPEEEKGAVMVPKKPTPFHPDSAEGRRALKALAHTRALGEWRAIGPSNYGGKVQAVAVDPNNSNNVYAAYEVGGLWGTHNDGKTWIPMFNGQQNVAFSSVVTHPTVPALVAAGLVPYGTGYFTSFNQNVGVVLSTDSGNTWKLIGPSDDPTIEVWEIGFGDSTGQVIYAPTQKGLYKTTNQGTTWTNILPFTGTDRVSFAVDPLNSNILLFAGNTLGVMRSTDAGATWTEVDNWVNPGTDNFPTILKWSTGTTVYAAAAENDIPTFKSTDEGATWTPAIVDTDFYQGTYDLAIAVDPYDANHVIIHGSYLAISTDGLQTLNHYGYAAGPDCLAVTFDPSNQGVVYDGGDDGVHRSLDGGNTWLQFDVGTLTNKSIGGSSYAVGTNGRIYFSPADYGGMNFAAGYGWHVYPGYEYTNYFVNPHDPNDLYLTAGDLARGASATQAGANIDPEPGVAHYFYNDQSLEFDPVDPNTIYFGKDLLFKSTDRGNTWTKIGIPGTTDLIYLVKVAPSNPQHIYASSSGYIWSTTNGGTSWVMGASIGAGGIAVSPANENTLYLSTGGGVYISTDGGNSVTQLTGFPSVSVQNVAVDPVVPARIFAVTTNGNEVLFSQDSGSTWQKLGTQLPLLSSGPTGSWLDIQGRNLYLGSGADVWEINLESRPLCSQLTFNPPSMTLPSAAGTYPLELFIPGNCSWTASSSQSWATIDTNGQSSGHAILYVTVGDNTANTLIRQATLTIAGHHVVVKQTAGPDPVQNGNVVTLSRDGKCVTSSGGNVVSAKCTANNPTQQFTLQTFTQNPAGRTGLSYYGGPAYCLANNGSYIDVNFDNIQIGTPITEYPGGCGGGEAFVLQPHYNGRWRIVGYDSLLCLNATGTGTALAACGPSSDYAIKSVSICAPAEKTSSSGVAHRDGMECKVSQ